MASEAKERMEKKKILLAQNKLTKPSTYWEMLELEGKKCLRDN